MTFTTRFAPSPTGPLHLGHAYSALLAHDMARAENGRFLLRIEDIDQTRCRPEWEAQIYEDLKWMGIHWDEPVMRQSERAAAYNAALDDLWSRDLLYPCSCTRRDIAAAASAPQEGGDPLVGPDGVVYPGTCRPKENSRHGLEPRPDKTALRLHMAAAAALVSESGTHCAGLNDRPIQFHDTGRRSAGQSEKRSITRDELEREIGDIVLSRKDHLGSYHLSVVLDDAAQGVTHVVRGADLFEATFIHVTLQRLLGLPTPVYHHHRLIRDENGKRLAKRDDARAIARFRSEGATPKDIHAMVGL